MSTTRKKVEIIISTLKKLFPVARCALTYANEWQLLVAVMLSAQCSDRQVNKVTQTLFVRYPDLKDYLTLSQEILEKEIYSTGFYRQKAKNILASAKQIHEKYHDTIPQFMHELLTLPGVARKTANVMIGELWGKSEGIAVDTHVRRLSRLYGLTTESSPEKIEVDLMKLVPQNEWREFTLRMIEYGRIYCPAKKHDHAHCPLVLALSTAS